MDIFSINPYELAKRLRRMADEGAPSEELAATEYWQGWNDAIGAHLSTLLHSAELIEMLAEANATLRQEAQL